MRAAAKSLAGSVEAHRREHRVVVLDREEAQRDRVIRSCSVDRPAARARRQRAHEPRQPLLDGDGVARSWAEPAAAVERLARHQPDERAALAQEVDVAVDQQLERRAQLAGALELRRRRRRDGPEAPLALGQQTLDHRLVEAVLAAEEIRGQR